MARDPEYDFGPCCVCGRDDETVRNFVALNLRGPVPGKGWGCLQCGLPQDGAMAIVCDVCLTPESIVKPNLREVIKGEVLNKERVAFSELPKIPFDHDYSKHPEVHLQGPARHRSRQRRIPTQGLRRRYQ